MKKLKKWFWIYVVVLILACITAFYITVIVLPNYMAERQSNGTTISTSQTGK